MHNKIEYKLSGVKIIKGNGKPIWIQLHNKFRQILSSDQIEPGTRLPSLRKTGEIFSISYITVSKVVDKLVGEGLLETREGSGIYTTGKKAESLKTVGVLLGDVKNYMLTNLFLGINNELGKRNIDMLPHSGFSLDESQKFILRMIKKHQPAGLIIYGDYLFANQLFVEEIIADVPIIVLNRCQNLMADGLVFSDDEHGMTKVVEAIKEKGHKNVLYFSSPLNNSVGILRCDTFEREARKRKLNFAVVNKVEDSEAGYLNAMRAVVEKRKFTAIACWNDSVAMGVMQFLHSKGIQIPKDIAVIGYGNLDFSDKLHPKLSTVEQYYEEMGREAVRLLVRASENRSYDNPVKKKIKTDIVLRGSL